MGSTELELKILVGVERGPGGESKEPRRGPVGPTVMAKVNHQSGGVVTVWLSQGRCSSLQVCLKLCGTHNKIHKNKRKVGL